jgi:hypothetical protein
MHCHSQSGCRSGHALETVKRSRVLPFIHNSDDSGGLPAERKEVISTGRRSDDNASM